MSVSTGIYVGIGSNIGDRLENLRRAASRLSDISQRIEFSKVYESAASGFSMQPEFLNVVCKLSTHLTPWDFLERTRVIEQNYGRLKVFPNAPRFVDVDIILWGQMRIKTPHLEVPHPRFKERAFVLFPLLDLDPFGTDPENGERIDLHVDQLGKGNAVKIIGSFPK